MKIIIGALASLTFGGNIKYLVENSENYWGGFVIGGIGLGVLELTRQAVIINEKTFWKSDNKKTKKDVINYKTFQDNLEKAKIKVADSSKAIKIYNNLIKVKENSTYIVLDIKKANKEIMESYEESLKKPQKHL